MIVQHGNLTIHFRKRARESKVLIATSHIKQKVFISLSLSLSLESSFCIAKMQSVCIICCIKAKKHAVNFVSLLLYFFVLFVLLQFHFTFFSSSLTDHATTQALKSLFCLKVRLTSFVCEILELLLIAWF